MRPCRRRGDIAAAAPSSSAGQRVCSLRCAQMTMTASPGGSSPPGKQLPQPKDLYRVMRLIRRFEERAIDLVRAGTIVSGIHPCIGQEAVAAGTGAALRRDDVMLANHRAHGQLLAKG